MAKMVPEVATCPAMTIAHTHSITIESFHWKNRLLLVTPSNMKTENQLKRWASAHEKQLCERKLQILIKNADNNWKELNGKFAITDSMSRYATCQNCLTLIGLDGGIKMQENITDSNLSTLFPMIDGMPIRRAEMQSLRDDSSSSN